MRSDNFETLADLRGTDSGRDRRRRQAYDKPVDDYEYEYGVSADDKNDDKVCCHKDNIKPPCSELSDTHRYSLIMPR